MQRCKISYFVPGKAEFHLQEGEEETAEELVEQLAAGRAPTWLETLVKEGLRIDKIEIEEVETLGRAPREGEELDFGEY